MKKLFLSALVACCLLASRPANAQRTDTSGHAWWQHAVFYEVYPRSFADSNGDGIGDLNGITSKLDYLHNLGIDAIWITPCFPSPQVDFGYDVSDYEAIDPMYGTMKDFDRLVAEARKRNIKVILDFVVNHTSDQHKWFIDSKSSLTAAHRDWYIWRDGKGTDQLPNNWVSTFGTPAWKFDSATKQYYYHYFYPEQPDLNWRNPAVEKAMFDTTRFWYKRGVVGFRLDAVDTMFEDVHLTDNPLATGTDKFGRPNMIEKFNKKQPEMHVALKGLRKVANDYSAVLIGETWTDDVRELKDYYGEHNDELQMPMDLILTRLPLSASILREHIAATDSSGFWPTYVITNHDIVRSYTRLGDSSHNDDIAKLMAAFYLTLRGTAIIYYGEEIGMKNSDPVRKEDVQDPIGRLGWPLEKGRDGGRTPMQWNSGPDAGFSTAKKTWLPIPESAKTYNVEMESKDPNSLLNFYKKLLNLRKNDVAMREGSYIALNTSDANVYAYLRPYKDTAIIVVLNMSASKQATTFDLSKQGLSGAHAVTLLQNGAEVPSGAFGSVTLAPYGTYVAKLSK